jgi:fructose-1,6-bisphosphatase/inositol monophosphatase family enzyme
MPDEFFVKTLRDLARRMRQAVLTVRSETNLDELAGVQDANGEGDTIYAIDRLTENALIQYVEDEIAWQCPCYLVAEGVCGRAGLPLGDAANRPPAESVRLLVDPIDGTRGIMTDKRSAWVLIGLAPNRGEETTLADVRVAVMTEIPTTKQWRSDTLWAVRGQGAFGEWEDILTGAFRSGPLQPRPSRATDLAHGFASFAKFFPGARDVLAAIEEDVLIRVVGPPEPGRAVVFEDQYISTGGQLYELIMGHDRFIADLRPQMRPVLESRGLPPSLTCHPYDLATVLIAEEAGVIVTDADGGPIRYPFDTETECSWIGYANPALHDLIGPALRDALVERGLLKQG